MLELRIIGQIVDAREPTREGAEVHVSSGLACGLALALLAPAAWAQPAPRPADPPKDAPANPPAKAPATPPANAAATAPADAAADDDAPTDADASADAKTKNPDAHVLPKVAKPSLAPPPPPDPIKEDAPTDPRVRPIEPGQGKPGPFGPDDRSGHIYIRGGTAVVLPAGSVRSLVATNAIVGPGLGFVADLGVGLSRHTELDLLGTYALMTHAGGEGAGACLKCKGDHASLSLGLIYHLAEGVAFDPWVRYGTGYRTADYEGSSSQLAYLVPGRFHGWDIAQLSLGASFFPTPSFGFGPFIEADIGTYVTRPVVPDNIGGARAYGFFQFGVRLELDPARWIKSSKAAPSRTAVATPPAF